MAVKRGTTRRRVRGDSSGVSTPAARRDEEALLTFSEAELREVLLEEFEWQRAMVKDLVQRMKRRRKDES